MRADESVPLLGSVTTLEVPVDKYNLAYIIFIIQGLGILLPWNAFISAAGYFTDLYGSTFVFLISIVFNWANVLCYILLMKVLPRFSFMSRVIGSLLLLFIVLLVIPFVDSAPIHISLIVTLVGVCITGIAAAIMQSTVAGMAALFPPQHMAALMSGSGVAGIVAIALRAITLASLPATTKGKQQSGRVFFILAASVAVVCAVTFVVLWNLPITKYYLLAQKRNTLDSPVQASFRGVLAKVWKEVIAVTATLFVTLSLFPGITNLVKSSNGIDSDWWPVIFTAVFLMGDFIGRTLPQFIKIFTPTSILFPVLARFSFFPLIIFCIHPHLIQNDFASCIILAVFAISNGYCITLGMIYGTQSVSSSEKELAGMVLSGFLQGGIILGSHFAFLILYLVTGSIGI